MIEIKKLTKSFGQKTVLEGVDLTVGDGKIYGLVGINGAGKSTLLRLLAGVLRADGGSILFDGEEIFENEKKKRELFLLPDDPFWQTGTTGKKLLALYEAYYRVDRGLFFSYMQKFRLSETAPIQSFSKGMKRQLFVSLALACKPKYLLLDEAFDGLDPLARLEFRRGLVTLVEEVGSTVIISSHSLRELEDICDGFALLDGGNVAEAGDLGGALDALCKFQVALPHEAKREDFPFECLTFEATGRVAKFVVRGDREKIEEALRPLAPLFVEQIPVDFEELFICIVKNRGYLQ